MKVFTGKKRVQFEMDAVAYERLKLRARESGIKTGEMVENLLAAMELRTARALRTSSFQKAAQHDSKMISKTFQQILTADENGVADDFTNPLFTQEFEKAMKSISKKFPSSTYTPNIKTRLKP